MRRSYLNTCTRVRAAAHVYVRVRHVCVNIYTCRGACICASCLPENVRVRKCRCACILYSSRFISRDCEYAPVPLRMYMCVA